MPVPVLLPCCEDDAAGRAPRAAVRHDVTSLASSNSSPLHARAFLRAGRTTHEAMEYPNPRNLRRSYCVAVPGWTEHTSLFRNDFFPTFSSFTTTWDLLRQRRRARARARALVRVGRVPHHRRRAPTNSATSVWRRNSGRSSRTQSAYRACTALSTQTIFSSGSIC